MALRCRSGACKQPLDKGVHVDFGLGARIEGDGKKHKPNVFRAVLGFSRKGYVFSMKPTQPRTRLQV